MLSDLPAPRSAGALTKRRVQMPWPADREFRILAIDGGGIKGIYPACVLAQLEARLGGGRICDYFDMIVGTSTGGILALALSLGLPAQQIASLYLDQGDRIFPPPRRGIWGWANSKLGEMRSLVRYRYDRQALHAMLDGVLKAHVLGDARTRLCIPSAEGRHGDVYVFKTPHHRDYQRDWRETMTKIASATSAAPTFFPALDSDGYRFVDGGLWANNPIMVGVVDALASYDIDRHRVRVLSLGCGDEPFFVSDWMAKWGGQLMWTKAIFAAMAYQSHNAMGQAQLLLGAERILRLSPGVSSPIRLDDWQRARNELPPLAAEDIVSMGDEMERAFLYERIQRPSWFVPYAGACD